MTLLRLYRFHRRSGYARRRALLSALRTVLRDFNINRSIR